ncbi:addiction module protein [Haloferula sargassicola]|uniref:Addiction module protein n=1 Tax=Haloferula sargassicola TaxID=490096 RepID=A0ABP9UWR2_9BACT
MSIDQIAPEALKLPARERALLAASLWESVEDPFELALDFSDDEAIELAEARDREIESGVVSPISHAELMQRLRE